ncbi:MAG: hypothetical protein CMH62_01135 [Nanoarchaeota archaeon]|nr:hypothetical protein [Nanoarchaeota archaeon]|tara:strand:+ start:2241 stop:2459 length:219 start_codon:yes stop_codon:yes gene_type:complete
MTANNVIRIMVTKYQKERILQNASIKGYVTISGYMRDLALNKNQFVEDKLKEIVRRIEKIEESFEKSFTKNG